MRSADHTILLAEDNSNDVLLLRRAFRKAGVANRLEVVSDGEEAIAYLAGDGGYADRERHPLPSLVLMDVELPRKSGFEVLTWLRQQPGLRRLPVALLGASDRPTDIRRGYEAGANAYHVKPDALDELVAMARTFTTYTFTRAEAAESPRKPRASLDDADMFPPGADPAVSVKSKVYGLLSRHPAGLTPEALARELLSRGLAVGELAPVAKHLEEVLKDLEIGRFPRRVVRTEDGHYRAAALL